MLENGKFITNRKLLNTMKSTAIMFVNRNDFIMK